MSQADVDLVRALVPSPEVDWAAVIHDEAMSRQLRAATTDLFDPGFRCCMSSVTDTWREGMAGLWAIWEEWLEPWSSYHIYEEEIRDLGDGRVLWMGRDVGGRPDDTGDVTLLSSAIWTVSSGKVSEVVFYASRERALQVADAD